ncbi:methyltransferase domain-containing protein [Candidatus Uabimicrobium amorphum]|uniref:Arsenite methyltransferase n=1 Tax=Uabimicrobium amorphum TaxID=2596890 RepID=A0A5S9F610_UABAM|nr:methyltransferase domain-containing protein [Candidatus Uabimicrobium amorphum]BBM87188.1 methyltransferase [Candidatus Uabimicrobium amorphum]
MENTQKHDSVREYYGKELNNNKDIKTSACCASGTTPKEHVEILKKIDKEILDKFYGCGAPIPPILEGKVVVDLGCGTGRDSYILSQLVGPQGRVIGVDMTEEQLEIARRHIDTQMQIFGFDKPNVEFRQGYIEKLDFIEDNSVDLVISNCVINLSPNKHAVFSEIFRVLKPGGELYFSDVFSNSRVPQQLKSDPVLYGECLAGAMYVEDFRRLLQGLGCMDYRVISSRRLSIDSADVEAKIGMISFYSMTMRAFKLDSLEDVCEDYGQVATYLGNIPTFTHKFVLDREHTFVTHKPIPVCGNTAAMLQETRYKPYFKITGDRSRHFGVFGKNTGCC